MTRDKGLVFNIQKYSVHDGPGIRTIVFFKGCPLACRWCSNPEGISHLPEISYKSSKCIGVSKCGFCVKACLNQAIRVDEEDKAVIDHSKCGDCTICSDKCPAQAIERMGRMMSVEEILKEVMADELFYSRSGGGITVSGGEPLLQAEFVTELLKQAHREGLETAIETTGCVPWEQAQPVFEQLDFIHMDIKSVDPVKHKAFTGRDNALILENFRRLCESFPDRPIIARTPVVPGFNDNVEALQAIVDFINEVGASCTDLSYELLPFHNFGSTKYAFQGKSYYYQGYGNMDKIVVEELRAQLRSPNVPILPVR